MSRPLLSEYQKLSQEYDKILDLSQRLLSLLNEKDKSEERIESLLKEKSKIVEKINLLSEKVSFKRPSCQDKKDIQLIKKELEKIETKAYQLLELEKKVKLLVQKEI